MDDSAIAQKYKEKLAASFGEKAQAAFSFSEQTNHAHTNDVSSREYSDFRKEILPKSLSLYEKMCGFAQSTLRIAPDPKKRKEYQDAINTTHLSITPEGAQSFAILYPLLFGLIGGLLSFLIPSMLGEVSLFFPGVIIFVSLMLVMITQKIPLMMAKSWRMSASNQMIMCVFYIVTFMRHSSNYENALRFAASHLQGPLALDLRKVMWDVETEKFESFRESMDDYLQMWKGYNDEFVQAMHLVEASLLESSNDRRLQTLDKALQVILDETFEKMLHYAHGLKSPITTLHMLGVIMPILGLVILPLVINLMGGVKWYAVATLYNVLLPLIVFYFGKNILSDRPTGYGDSEATDKNPYAKHYQNIKIPFGPKTIELSPLYFSVLIGAFCILLSLLPFLVNFATPLGYDLCLDPDFSPFNPLHTSEKKSLVCFLEYRQSQENSANFIGPFGLGAALMSVLFIIGVGYSIGFYYKTRSKQLMAIREGTQKLEDEFAAGLFQLGSRMADGLPPEIAFGKVAQALQGTPTGGFFELVSNNITRLGMSVEEAIFNERNGALLAYNSPLINSSMKVLVESARKGPKIAAQAVMNVSQYIKEIHRVNERLRDLMADIIGDMKSQIKFLAPAISAITVGITSMITYILGKLATIQLSGSAAGAGGIASLFAGDGMPIFHFQVIVGLYVVQLVYILTTISSALEHGNDKLQEEFNLGVNMTRSTILYSSLVLVVLALFNFLAGTILSKGVLG